MKKGDLSMEELNRKLNDAGELALYKTKYDAYRPALVPRMLGTFLVWSGNAVYGHRPSYQKFRAVEVIARVPYHSWASAAYTWLTMFYTNEMSAMKYSKVTAFAEHAQANETMHVVVISQLAQKHEKTNVLVHSIIPVTFAFFYFWVSYFLYIVNPRYSYELNYLFESHAYDQYNEFLTKCGEELKERKVESPFLEWYGRHPANQYEFFLSIRNDELIHRNLSIEEIELLKKS